MKQNIILVLVVVIVLIVFALENYQNRKSKIKITPGEIMRRHIVFYSMLVMVGSLVGGVLFIGYFLFDASLKYFLGICMCLVLLFISKMIYSKNKL